MILEYPTNHNPAYRLTHDLAEPSFRSTVRRVSLDQTDEESVLLEKLGTRGWGRIHYFRSHFDAGWGENGTGKAVSPKAYEAFSRFVQAATFPEGTVPSVFLTDEGGIELCWEDKGAKPIQIEFQRNGAEYFVGATQSEGFVGYDEIDHIAKTVGV